MITGRCRLAEIAGDARWSDENAAHHTRTLFLEAVAHRRADDATAEDER